MEHHHFQLFMLNIDIIWMTRNKLAHEGRFVDIMQLIKRVKKVSGEHLLAWQQKKGVCQPREWSPPPLGLIKVNFDTAIRETFVVVLQCCGMTGLVIGVVQNLSPTDLIEGEVMAGELGIKEAVTRDLKRL